MLSIKPKSRIFLKDNVVFEVGSNLYDEKDVERCVQNIISVVEGMDKWVLLSIPDKSKGITPEAAHMAVPLLKQALKENCEAILILTSNTSGKIFAHALKEHGLNQQLFCSESLMELLEKAESILNNPTLFMDCDRQKKQRTESV